MSTNTSRIYADFISFYVFINLGETRRIRASNFATSTLHRDTAGNAFIVKRDRKPFLSSNSDAELSSEITEQIDVRGTSCGPSQTCDLSVLNLS